jgi:hypothetical protein
MNTSFQAKGMKGVVIASVLGLLACIAAGLVLVGCDNPPPPPAPKKATNDTSKVSQTATNVIVLETNSVFDADPRLTKDPFFPKSQRRLARATKSGSAVPQVAILRLRGVIGSPGKYIAMINDKTFAVGDKSQVLVGPNQTMIIRVNKINTNSVNISADGESAPRELLLDTVKEVRK